MRAIIVVTTVGFLLGTLAEDCEINVSESLVKRLSNSTQSDVHCGELWQTVVNNFHQTRQNLTTCHELALAASATESFALVCQQQLQSMMQEMQNAQNNHTNTLKQKIEQNKSDAKKYQTEAANLQRQAAVLGRGLKSFYRDLIFLNIDAGSSKQAIKYFHRYLEGGEPGPLLNDLIVSVYRDPTYENERFEHLLDFARKLAGSSLKLSLYHKLFPAMLKHPNQRDSYLAMILALDIAPVAFADQNNVEGRRMYLTVFEPALAYLKGKVEAGNYDEIVTFATKYPTHFEEIENRLSTLDNNVWQRIDFNRFVTYPNRLPLGRQRLEAFRMLLLQINQRNKQDYTDYLIKLAKELEKCETFVTSGKNEPADLEKLRTVKGLFAKLDRNKDYEYYLQEAKKQ
uniref:Uncharacterized protein n=1 Tax=Anopheles culicifacies TaxID=139723 RepID=A0A2C9GUM9_9DIPT